MNPLETRSLPKGLWQFVPARIAQADETLRHWMAQVSLDTTPWKQIRWLTEDPKGISLGILLILGLGLTWSTYRNKSLPLPRTARSLWQWAAFALLLGLSDSAARGIKLVIGRLKPHVTFYNPNFTPALSCPSNHAFNTAFALSLAWYALLPQPRERFRVLVLAATLFVAGIGLTRVMFGQHYPIDVVAGWILGGALGRLVAPLYGWLSSLRTERS